MLDPPRPILSREEIDALPDDEKTRAIAEWSSYFARLKREREEQEQWSNPHRDSYRGTRGRGGYRGAHRGAHRGGYRGGYQGGYLGRGAGHHNHQPYPTAHQYRPQFTNVTATFNHPAAGTRPDHTSATSNRAVAKFNRKTIACRSFTATGVCSRSGCPYSHDPDKTAICKHFLFKDNCTNGDACALSHAPSPHRSPSCVHFQNGKCFNDHCRYSHVHVNPAAPVCEAFARWGYCEKGDKCTDRHVYECPDFTNKGACRLQGCRLPHIVHAGRLRKAAGSHPSSDVEASPAPGNPDVVRKKERDLLPDSSNTESINSRSGARTLLSQQVDYVPFET